MTAYLTPPVAAKQLGVTPERIIAWIKSGRLRAVNLSDGVVRPRYRVSADDLADFLRTREVAPATKTERRPRRKYKFFPD